MSSLAPQKPTRDDTSLLAGVAEWRVWSLLAWQDIRTRYRGSALGPLWMVANLAVICIGITILYSELLNQKVETFMPFLAVSLVLMNFIWPILLESCHAFATATDVIRQVKLPLSTLVMRVLYRNCIIAAHNLVVVLVVFAIFNKFLTIKPLELLFGIGLLIANLAWMSVLFAILGARFRDMIQLTQSVLNFMSIFTPIYWVPALISRNQILLDINPLYHLFQVVRQPFLGADAAALNYIVAISMALIGGAITWIVFERTRKQVVYWV